MTSLLRPAGLVVTWMLLLAGCAERPLMVGVKDFTEQRLLAEMLRERAKQAGVRVEVKPCGDTFGCQQRLRAGRLDVLFEYSGTGALHAGASAEQRNNLDVDTLNSLYAPYGVRWLAPLGFSNGYRVVVTEALKERYDLQGIRDLSQLPSGVRMTCPSTFLRRTGDGLGPLLNVHGLKLAARPLLHSSPTKRAEALLQGQADVAVFYETDGAVGEASGLTSLNDTLGFFPAYDAFVVAREDVVAGPKGEVLKGLTKVVTSSQMRSMNAAVDDKGFSARGVAQNFISGDDRSTSVSSESSMQIAHQLDDKLDVVLKTAALRVVREAFPGRPVVEVWHKKPVQQLNRGARFAVVGVGELLRTTRRGQQRVDGAEAVVVVGTRHLHQLRKTCDAPPTSWGVQAGDVGKAGRAYVKAANGKVGMNAGVDALVDGVGRGEVDAALVHTTAGAVVVTQAMQQGLKLCPLDDLATPSWLRRTLLPKGTYPTQAEDVLSRSEQIVLAGPRPQNTPAQAAVGPAAALSARAPAVSADEFRALSTSTTALESPDPVAHTSWTRLSSTVASDEDTAVVDTLLSLLLMLFVGWVVHQVFVAPPEGLPNASSS